LDIAHPLLVILKKQQTLLYFHHPTNCLTKLFKDNGNVFVNSMMQFSVRQSSNCLLETPLSTPAYRAIHLGFSAKAIQLAY